MRLGTGLLSCRSACPSLCSRASAYNHYYNASAYHTCAHTTHTHIQYNTVRYNIYITPFTPRRSFLVFVLASRFLSSIRPCPPPARRPRRVCDRPLPIGDCHVFVAAGPGVGYPPARPRPAQLNSKARPVLVSRFWNIPHFPPPTLPLTTLRPPLKTHAAPLKRWPVWPSSCSCRRRSCRRAVVLHRSYLSYRIVVSSDGIIVSYRIRIVL